MTEASLNTRTGGGLALLRNGDRVRIDLKACTADMLVPLEELAERARALEAAGGYDAPESQSPWQALFRAGARGTMHIAVARRQGTPRTPPCSSWPSTYAGAYAGPPRGGAPPAWWPCPAGTGQPRRAPPPRAMRYAALDSVASPHAPRHPVPPRHPAARGSGLAG